ncbi:hypothetical protein [Flavobacterium sp. B17]|uniref:hypothetical protein n=1 Tax=Flavobacterium sp. B17 TaxID=95618 RepID=UPI0003478FE1|nr:hypothetical protein [Flavobacterium sp. B17]
MFFKSSGTPRIMAYLPQEKGSPGDQLNGISFGAYTKKNPEFILQQTEAVEVIEFPITCFLNLPDQPEIMALSTAGGSEVPVINFNGYIIWGATAMILSEFSQLLKKM